ncbi:MAG: ATP-binding protein [Marvinbryantia sp.]|jgi:signal transduction histidine kinase
MKLSWKLFFLTTPVFILFLTIFGSWTLQDGFQNKLDQKIRRCLTENQMFQNSYELTRHNLTEKQLERVPVRQLVESFYRTDVRNEQEVRILDADGEVLYQEWELQLPHSIREKLTEENNVGYELIRQQDRVYLVVMCMTGEKQYIETTADISGLYVDRAQSYSRYRIGMLLVSLALGCVILLVIMLVMREVRILSRAVRRFAQGEYDVRVGIQSRDEIGRLAADFNWMADVMETQMVRLQSEVERQEEFTSAFAHELKTPLTSIIGYADTLRQMELSPEETSMCADYIFRQGKRLQSLSYKLLELAMVGKNAITLKEISAVEFLEYVIQIADPMLKKKGIILDTEVQDGTFYGDRDLLSSVFVNFLDNAGKASAAGSRVVLSGRREQDGYTVIVEDHGRGIEKEELSKITEAFYMVDKSRSRKEGGAGLGLALCRKILELHRAVWKIESEPGNGTKITVSFYEAGQATRERRKRRKRNER